MTSYSSTVQKKVSQAIHEMHEGRLRNGKTGKKVTSIKQAIAIGLSQAREEKERVAKSKQGKSQAKSN